MELPDAGAAGNMNGVAAVSYTPVAAVTEDPSSMQKAKVGIDALGK